MVPIRFFAEAFSYTIAWEPKSQVVKIIDRENYSHNSTSNEQASRINSLINPSTLGEIWTLSRDEDYFNAPVKINISLIDYKKGKEAWDILE